MLPKEDRAGIYITVIFHLAVIIILLASQIGYELSRENSFILDFTRQEQIEKEENERDFREDVSRHIDELLAAAQGGDLNVRNIAVDRSQLKDDRGTDAQKLYEDAQRLAQDLENTFSREDKETFTAVEEIRPEKKDVQESQREYQDPSVVSYELEGRHASKLPIPAYRCMGAGLVTVNIVADPQGNVLFAKVDELVSSEDRCLRDFAVRAARLSKFSVKPDAPARQGGNIVYQFIAQR
ncbi:MAG: hypothetical protein IJS07_00290 [Bacteroidales bacterium]|nr:hypothetical protein [Bacteroidales bacterium]